MLFRMCSKIRGSGSSLIYLRALAATGVSSWVDPQPVTVVSTTLTVTSQTTQITGDLILSNTSSIVLTNPQQQIVVSGEAVLSGSISLSVNSSGSFTVVTAQQGVTGTFSNVMVSSPTCTSTSGGATYSTLSVVINVQASGCSSATSAPLSPGAIAGIAVGATVGFALIVILVVVIARKRRQRIDAAKNKALAMAIEL